VVLRRGLSLGAGVYVVQGVVAGGGVFAVFGDLVGKICGWRANVLVIYFVSAKVDDLCRYGIIGVAGAGPTSSRLV